MVLAVVRSIPAMRKFYGNGKAVNYGIPVVGFRDSRGFAEWFVLKVGFLGCFSLTYRNDFYTLTT